MPIYNPTMKTVASFYVFK